MNIKPPKNHDLIMTSDGSKTLKSHRFDENCHSTSGAYQETIYNFVTLTKLNQLPNYAKINILEVGFGLGYGAKAVFEEMNNTIKINFISFEIDLELIKWAIENTHINNTEYPTYKDLKYFKTDSHEYFYAEKNGSTLIVIVGDARETITMIGNIIDLKYDFIFQDAFSPKKNKSLWTVEWFLHLKNISKPDVILTTYSSSSAIRKSLICAHWFIEHVQGFGIKKSATRANLKKNDDPELYIRIKNSTREPLTD